MQDNWWSIRLWGPGADLWKDGLLAFKGHVPVFLWCVKQGGRKLPASAPFSIIYWKLRYFFSLKGMASNKIYVYWNDPPFQNLTTYPTCFAFVLESRRWFFQGFLNNSTPPLLFGGKKIHYVSNRVFFFPPKMWVQRWDLKGWVGTRGTRDIWRSLVVKKWSEIIFPFKRRPETHFRWRIYL